MSNSAKELQAVINEVYLTPYEGKNNYKSLLDIQKKWKEHHGDYDLEMLKSGLKQLEENGVLEIEYGPDKLIIGVCVK